MEMETERNPTPANEEIQKSILQCQEIVSSEAKKEIEQKEPTEKRKREEEEERGNPPKLEADSGRNPLWKTTLCSYFRRNPAGVCSHGNSCRYAHGEAELRPRPDNSWDPTSERAKKLHKTNGSRPDNKLADDDDDDEEDPIGEEENDDTSLDKCLMGLPRNWASDNLKSFLDAQGILYKEAKKKKKMTVGFVVFENVEQVKNAIEVLSEKTASGKQIKIANASRRSLDKKHLFRTTETESGNVNLSEDNAAADEASVTQGLVPKAKSARDVVTPLAHMSYNDQLEHKRSSLQQILKRLTRNARKACPNAVPLPEWILNSREIGGLPCKLEGILGSPVIDGYRNKCEFSVGYSLEGKRTVGFMMGNFREGVVAVEEPLNCPNVSKISCKYALIFQDYLQSSAFPVWNRINNTGFWRQFTVREGRNPSKVSENQETYIAEVMLIVQVCSVNVDEEHMKTEFKRMVQDLALGAASSTPPLPLTKIIVQDHRGISNAAPADCPLLSLPIPEVEGHSFPDQSGDAEARIHDYISNLRFSISPTAFFQVNTLAAEKLYSLAGDWAELSQDTLLFDICCGTGTIGLTLAHRVGMVIGIEMNESAVSDAQRNAQTNGITNCKFVCGKAEDVMARLLKEYLGTPQQDNGVYRSSNTDKDVNAIVENENEEHVLDDGASVDNLASHASPEGDAVSSDGSKPLDSLLNLDAESRIEFSEENSRNEVVLNAEIKINSNKENGVNELLAIESSNNETDGTKGSTAYLKKCSIESGTTRRENEELRDETQENLKAIDSNKEDLESREIGEEKVGATVLQFKNIVAIVDPPRVGLHPIVIKALRTHSRLRRLVYISCNPESLVANAIELCTPSPDKLEKAKGHRGWRSMSSAGLARHRTKTMPISEPFRPVKAMAVDLFPHTPHCEMVMLLER